MSCVNFDSYSNLIAQSKSEQVSHSLQPRPFVKWVGGKRAILKELLKYIPSQINNYYEPFVGGGALFFEKHNTINGICYLSDKNLNLIRTYQVIKEKPQELIGLLRIHKEKHSAEYYYKIRALHEPSNVLESSARFIYLMKTCYNGLYRVNSKNKFNTPIGRYKNPNICDEVNIVNVSRVLQKTKISHQDFKEIKPHSGDFVYFDPPYHPISENSFVKYLADGFTKEDQIRLRDFALDLSKKGVSVMISNSDTEFVRDIYKEKDFNITRIYVPRIVNCKSGGRGCVPELIITSY